MNGADLKTERLIFSVSDITRNVRFTLEANFSNVWVEGEISGLKRHTSGHMYFCLKDEFSQIQCVMFRKENQVLPFDLNDGQHVLCFGRVSVYAVRGQYQLYVERMEPKGVGALGLRFEQLKEKLRLEGLFAEERKRPIPFLPSRIGVVTSLDGAALHDILHVLNRRFSNVSVLIYPVPVQGNTAAACIAAAIDDLNRLEAADVLIVGRGGGSLEDLWAFNEEIVARAIVRSGIPVISAVGHEVDFTIADFAADIRAATPSAAAEIVMPLKEDLLLRLSELKARSAQAILARIKFLKQGLEDLRASRGLGDPLAYFDRQSQRLDELSKGIRGLIETLVLFKKERLASLIGKLDALGPLAVLKRGFSVTMTHPGGKVLVSTRRLRAGDQVRTRLSQGWFISQVKEIKP